MMKIYQRIICTLLAVSWLFAFASCNKEGGKPDGGKIDGQKDATYMATEGLLVYYIYSAAGSFSEEEIAAHNFDVNKSLKDQMYDETYTWYEILIVMARESLTSILTYCNAAADEGVTIDASDSAAIDETLLNKRVSAAAEGITLDKYLEETYGNSYITEAVLRKVYELQYLSAKYADILEDRFSASLTEAMVSEEIKAKGSTDTTPTRDIGLMVFSTDKYGSADDAKAKANSILAALKAEGQISAESFERSAKENSESKDIFFYNVADGDMQAAIDDWLYGTVRNVGDTGVITTDYGASIIYYESDGDPLNAAEAKVALVNKMFDEWYGEHKDVYYYGLTDELADSLELDF